MARVDDDYWLHSFELPDGTKTEGKHSVSYQRRKASLIPDDLSGKTVLDVGAGPGFYSILAAQRGADEVIAISDNDNRDKFEFVQDQYGTDVEYRVGDFFEMTFDRTFDVVINFGMLYHVPNPVELLEDLAELTGETFCFASRITWSPLRRSFLYNPRTKETEGDVLYDRLWPPIYDRFFDPTWRIPTRKWVDEHVESAGFEIQERKPFTTPHIHNIPLMKHVPAKDRVFPVCIRYSLRATPTPE